MVSLKARLVILLLKLTKRKQAMLSAESLHATIKQRRQTSDYRPGDKIHNRLDITEREIGGFPTYTVRPKGCERPEHYLYYLHGGAYTFEIIPQHWNFVATLAEMLNAEIMVPIYPLAPEQRVDAVLEFAHTSYNEFKMQAPEGRPIHMVGDSAGAGMLVAMCQQMVAAGKPQPKSLVLLSPFLDVVLDDPAVAEIDKIDPWLSPEGLREAGRLYAGEHAVSDARISPARGPVEGLPPVHIFMGTRDILQPSAKAFADKVKAAGGDGSYHDYEGMFHCWAALYGREAEKARDEMAAIIKRA